VGALAVQSAEIKGIRIHFWYVAPSQDAASVQTLLQAFTTSNHWDIQLEATAFTGYGELAERVEAGLYAADLPDVLAAPVYQALSWDANNKTLLDLTPYISDPTWGLTANEQSDFYAAFWPIETAPKSKRIGLPLHRSGLVLYYNLTWAKELGFNTPPASPLAFKRQACAAAKSNTNDDAGVNDGTGGWLVGEEPAGLAAWMLAFGGEIVRPDEKGYQFDTSEAAEAAEFIADLYASGCAWVSPGRYANAEFAARRALFLTGSTAGIPYQQTALQAAGNADEWTVIPFPATRQPVMIGYGPSLILTKSDPQRQLAAWIFAKWLVSPSNQAQWTNIYGGLPTRESALGFMGDRLTAQPQWDAAIDLIPYTRLEPDWVSWSAVRWMIGDATTQLLAPDFKAEQIPAILALLDKLAAEAQVQIR
jgi:ABC-type glycerol-3-phosphate transport system substrate-binding protein